MTAHPEVDRGDRAPAGAGGDDRERPLGTTANQLTMLRLLLVPLLWVVAALGKPAHLGIGVAVAGSTDVLDGYLARRSGETTAFGSRLDSIADHLLTLSTALWLLWLRPEFVREQLPALLLWGALALLVLLVGWVRFRRLGDLHLYSAKAAGTAGYLFAIWVLVFGSYQPAVFAAVIGLCYFSAAEALVALLLRRGVDEHVGTVLGRQPSP